MYISNDSYDLAGYYDVALVKYKKAIQLNESRVGDLHLVYTICISPIAVLFKLNLEERRKIYEK